MSDKHFPKYVLLIVNESNVKNNLSSQILEKMGCQNVIVLIGVLGHFWTVTVSVISLPEHRISFTDCLV